MARVIFVKKARKAQGKCRVCGKDILKDSPYKWTKPRYSSKIVACTDCTIPLSMTSSSKMVAIWESLQSYSGDDVSSIPDSLRDIAETAKEIAEEYQESADNQRQYFPDSEDKE